MLLLTGPHISHGISASEKPGLKGYLLTFLCPEDNAQTLSLAQGIIFTGPLSFFSVLPILTQPKAWQWSFGSYWCVPALCAPLSRQISCPERLSLFLGAFSPAHCRKPSLLLKVTFEFDSTFSVWTYHILWAKLTYSAFFLLYYFIIVWLSYISFFLYVCQTPVFHN